ncbi:LamB/YcsF family protein [Pelotomaculum schinkii]|uniref:LamB/YcsF family protein n=1 Tax=Pelotomaculum schinkii TaxID=78350 RepID=A0A4Y7RFJ7_9FIRM|nr:MULTISPECIES: 5-oxoprolinase subunit PxpA [Pelotomaculum]TEB07576.1 LamB/YcsF family protein [Pelotomaculum schinkii]TEB16356.1 LamB/YcsF family protein [Pelotomaculum sp. FP]
MDLNVDMGESFGRYKLGNDEEVMKYITSANVACGFHAGDSLVMQETVMLAKKYGVAVGAHTGLEDKRGFGRRRMEITPEELKCDTLYQLGALDAFLKSNGMTMQHIKPHGILYRMVHDEERYARAYLEAVAQYNPGLYVMIPRNTVIWKLGLELGLNMAAEILIDLSYDDDGNWVLERTKKARSPEEVAERAIMVARDKKITTISGKVIDAAGDTICCHGDSPNAAEVVKKVKEAFEKAGIPLKQLGAA